MAIEGRLGVGGVADLLSVLWQTERTGILELTAGGAERKLVLSDGAIVYVMSTAADERLAVRLATSGAATREQLMKASKPGADLRAELVALGTDAAAYDRVLVQLVTDVVERVFALTEGTYSFMDRAEVELPGSLEDLPMTPILWRAARGCPPAFAAGFLGSLGSRVLKTGSEDLLQELPDLSPQEGFLISRIDGYGSCNDLLSLLPLPQEQVLRLLVGLTCVGYVDVQGRPGVKLPRPAKTSGKRKKAAAPAKPAGAPASASLQSHAGALPGSAPASAPEPELEGIEAARALLAKTKDADHYAVLGIPSTGTEEDVRKAYYKLARSFHPDRFGKDLAGRDRETVEDLFARISESYTVLASPERREEYDQKLKSGQLAAEKAKEKPVEPKELARLSFEKGKALVTLGDRGRALSFFEHAAETDPDNWEFRMTLARFLMSESRLRKRAEQQLQEAIRIDQTKAEAYYLLGQLYKMAGVTSRALEQFRQGLKWDAGHAGILKEMAELGEKGGDAASGGLLGGFFKKK